jgi:hypothetical protein
MSPNANPGCVGNDGLAFIDSEPADPDVILDAHENDDFWLPSRERNTRVLNGLQVTWTEVHTRCTRSHVVHPYGFLRIQSE